MLPSQLTTKRLKTSANTKDKAKDKTKAPIKATPPVKPLVASSAGPKVDPMAQALAFLLKDHSLADAQAFNQTELQEALSEAVIDHALINTLKSDAFKQAYRACQPNSDKASSFDPRQSIRHYAKQANLTSAHLRLEVKKSVCASQGASSSVPKRPRAQMSHDLSQSASLQTVFSRRATPSN